MIKIQQKSTVFFVFVCKNERKILDLSRKIRVFIHLDLAACSI